MNIRTCGLCCLALGLMLTSEAVADDVYSTPITAASADNRDGDKWWGPAGSLIPEAEWRPYVGRKHAFYSGGPVSSDPARMPKLGSTKGSGKSGGGSGKAAGSKSSGSKAAVAKTPAAKPDPCEEKVRQALEEAVRTGKIPASAAPQAAGPTAGQALQTPVSPQAASQTAPAAVPPVAGPMAQVQVSTAPAPAIQGPSASGVVQVVPPPAAPASTYPYSSGATSVAPSGTAAQGTSAPNPVMAGSPPRTQPPFSVE